jgi:adenylate cyclase
MKELERLVAYVPVTLVRQILHDNLPPPGRPHTVVAATLFSDISGFTAMSEELGTDGPRGAEEVNRVLLLTFTGMIDLIHQFGGAVSHFYGDAMSVYFPDEDGTAAQRALACAQQMQQLMLNHFSHIAVNRPAGKDPFFELTIKIGLSYGPCQEMIVGDPARALEFVLTGTAVDEAAAAEQVAQSGQVIVSQALLQQLDRPATAPFTVWTEPTDPPAARPLLNWSTYDEADRQRLLTAVIPFIPQAIHERMSATGSDNLAEHRPVTSLFVQFELNGRAAAAKQLQSYFNWASAVVARFGSRNARLNRVLTGDKGNQLHIIFGAPVAPDAPDQAVLCALALQRERPDYVASQRIGLAAGKVFAGPVGSASRREYTVVGDVVNLSARLMQVCEDGAVITGEATAQRVRDLITFTELPAVQVKGKQAPVKLFRAQQQQATTTQLQVYYGRWQRPLVGRDEELAQLRQALDTVRTGSGRCLFIAGPTGVGKTRFLAAGVSHWLAMGGRGMVGVCQPHTADTPYAPWRNIWNDLIGLNDSMSAQEQAVTVVAWTLSLVPDAGDDVGLWAEVLGLPIGQSSRLKELTAEVRQARFFALVRRCLQEVAANQPLLIILEDLHWADQSTLALIDELGQHLTPMPVGLILTNRDGLEETSLKISQQETTRTITLQDLSPTFARQVLAQLLGTGTAELPPIVEQHLGLRDREGRDSPVNPLFLEEALRVMMGMGVLQVNGRLQIDEARLSQMQLPDTIHGMLLARLDRLPAAGRHLLQVASVIGRQFAREPLSQMVPDLPSPAIADLLSDLSEEEITQLVTADPEWIYLFQHAMTHEVAYESLPYARRQALHAAVADWLVTHYADNLKPLYPVLAYHYDRANQHQPALEYALAAADAARDVFANREAVELYTLAEKHLKALGEAERWETAVHIYLEQGQCLRYIGDFSQSASYFRTALHIAQTHDYQKWIAHSYNLLAEVKYRQAYFAEVIDLTTKVVEICNGKLDLNDELSLALLWRGMSATSLQQYDLALSDLEKARTICEESSNLMRLARVWEAMAFVHYSQRNLENALLAMQKSVQLSRDYSIPTGIASALNNIALIQFSLGRPREASATLDEAISLVEGISSNFLAQSLANKAELSTYLGDFSEALVYFQEAIRLFKKMDDEAGLIEVHLLWGYEYESALGNLQKAHNHFLQAKSLIEQRPEHYPEEKARLLIGLAQLSLLNGSAPAAKETIEQANRLVVEKELLWWQPVVAYFQGECHRIDGDIQQAKAVWESGIMAIKSNFGCPDYAPLILLGLAKIATSPDEREALLLDCLKKVEKRARYIDQFFCFREAGKMLVESNNPTLKQKSQEYAERAYKYESELNKLKARAGSMQ